MTLAILGWHVTYQSFPTWPLWWNSSWTTRAWTPTMPYISKALLWALDAEFCPLENPWCSTRTVLGDWWPQIWIQLMTGTIDWCWISCICISLSAILIRSTKSIFECFNFNECNQQNHLDNILSDIPFIRLLFSIFFFFIFCLSYHPTCSHCRVSSNCPLSSFVN